MTRDTRITSPGAGPAASVTPPCAGRQPNADAVSAPPLPQAVSPHKGEGVITHGAPWGHQKLRDEIERIRAMDHQSRLNNVICEAILEYLEGREIPDEIISNALADADQDMPTLRRNRDLFARSEAEA